MKTYSLFIFSIFTSFLCTAQVVKRPVITNTIKQEIKDQGGQEDDWAKELFFKEYKVERYNKYKGFMSVNGNDYRYGDIVITIYPNPELKTIFDKGIFYPGIISKAHKYDSRKLHVIINQDSIKAWRKTNIANSEKKKKYAFHKIDSLFITDFEEIKFLEKTSKQKRFRFLMYTRGFANPIVYFMELSNKNANPESDATSFISGAMLTFFKEGWVSI